MLTPYMRDYLAGQAAIEWLRRVLDETVNNDSCSMPETLIVRQNDDGAISQQARADGRRESGRRESTPAS